MANQTNEEFLSQLMNFNPAGAFCQIFILEAIRMEADRVSKMDDEEYRKYFTSKFGAYEQCFFNPDAWRVCVKHIAQQFEERGKKNGKG